MNPANLARLGVLAAIVALPACSGGGASAPVAPSTAFISSVRMGTVSPESVRTDFVKPVAATATVSASSVRTDIIAPAKAAVTTTTKSVRLGYVRPNSVRTDVVPPAKASATAVKATSSVRLGRLAPNSVRTDVVAPATASTRSSLSVRIEGPRRAFEPGPGFHD